MPLCHRRAGAAAAVAAFFVVRRRRSAAAAASLPVVSSGGPKRGAGIASVLASGRDDGAGRDLVLSAAYNYSDGSAADMPLRVAARGTDSGPQESPSPAARGLNTTATDSDLARTGTVSDGAGLSQPGRGVSSGGHGGAAEGSQHGGIQGTRHTVAAAVLEMQGELQEELADEQLLLFSVLGRGGYGTVYHGARFLSLASRLERERDFSPASV